MCDVVRVGASSPASGQLLWLICVIGEDRENTISDLRVLTTNVYSVSNTQIKQGGSWGTEVSTQCKSTQSGETPAVHFLNHTTPPARPCDMRYMMYGGA